jgi:hypothetical protein
MISYLALAVISAAILAYEVLLVRLFAIVQWHHFAFMAISIALLGFGASGFTRPMARRVDHASPRFSRSAALFAVSAPASFLALRACRLMLWPWSGIRLNSCTCWLCTCCWSFRFSAAPPALASPLSVTATRSGASMRSI